MATMQQAGETALGLALLKLLEVVDEENTALGQLSIISHAGYTDRKNQALRELMAANRHEMLSAEVDELRPTLELLSEALRTNGRLLKNHIAAVGEVSDILVGSLRASESDGTYSRDSGSQRWR